VELFLENPLLSIIFLDWYMDGRNQLLLVDMPLEINIRLLILLLTNQENSKLSLGGKMASKNDGTFLSFKEKEE
jgi:hypothetical protein